MSEPKRRFSALKLANPGQILLAQANEEIGQDADRQGIAELVQLADALGARDLQIMAYLTPAPAAPTPAAATQAPAATLGAPAAAVTATLPALTSVPPSAPAASSGPAPSSTPDKPHVTANVFVNIRSGPGTAYPVIGQLAVNQSIDLMARNATSDWWRIVYPTAEQAWVSGQVVEVSGGEAIAIAENIPVLPTATIAPTRPPVPTQPPAATQLPAATQPTAAPAPTEPPAQPKPSGVAYAVKSLRLRSVAEGQCHGGDHNIWVFVQDAQGNRLDGVRVHEIFTNSTNVTGAQGKGAGTALWDIYRGGGGQVEIVDDAGNRVSEVSRGLSADWPDADLMWAAGYCGCKPYPDQASCAAGLANKEYQNFNVGHYVYEVVFQRTN